MAYRFSTEVIRRVYDDDDGVYIEVSPDADGLDLVQLSTKGDSEEHYGKLRLCLVPDQARRLAAAMIACADESDAAEKERKSKL